MAKDLGSYRKQVAAQQEAARKFLETSLRAFYKLNPDVNSDDFKLYASQLITQALRQYGDQAAVVACLEYDATAMELGYNVAPADILNEVDEDSVKRSVEYFIGAGNATESNIDYLVKNMVTRANDHVIRAANKTIVANAERPRDRKAGMRYARVPTGRETCGFCLLLASRGFVYKTAYTAGAVGRYYNYYHSNCDCIVVCGNEDTEIEGYNPDWYLKVYEDARKTAGITNSTTELNKLVNEINRRNREWVWFGKDGKIAIEEGAKPKQKELRTAKKLNSHGFDVEFLKPANTAGSRTADAKINHFKWEFKQPQGDITAQTIGKNTIYHQFEEAAGQSRRLVIDISAIENYPSLTIKELRDEASYQFYRRWQSQFDELIVIDSKNMRRYTR